jgi:RHS repeat-associated protein
VREPNGPTRFYVPDGHGSVRLLTDTAGAVTDTYTYDAFGILLAQSGPTTNWFRYAGEYYDPDLGLIHLRNREMNPNTGRFWTPDSFEGFQTDPLSLHKYLYAHNNPVNLTDPSGMAVREIPSNFELGNLVEDAVAVDFKAKRPASFADRSIYRILERIPGYKGVGRLRPDFADPIAYEIYDVKSWGETAEGFAKVELYVALLRSSDINPDPNRGAWHAGSTYQMTVPVFPVPGKPKIYAQVYPSFAGVIPYKLYQVDNDEEWRYIPVPVTVPEELRRLVWNGRTEREWRFAPQYAYNAAKYTAALGVAAITGYALGQAAIRAQMIPILRF